MLFSLFRPFHPNNVHFASQLLKQSLKILGIEFEVEGLENIQIDGPGIIISNHQNTYDILTATEILPRRTVTLGKHAVIFIPFFGVFYWLTGNILIKRSHHGKAMDTMSKVRDKIINQNLKVWILPEGHRNWGKGLLPFKKGAFYTAIQTQAPIIPVCFNEYCGKINLNKWKSAKIKIKILEPVITTGMTEDDVNPLLEKCRDLLSTGISSLN